jgi:hypothetical protein
MFDRVHTLERCGQVKCWGKSLADWTIGSHPRLYTELESDELRGLDEDDDLVWRGRPSELTDYQVLMAQGFLVVQGREWIDWVDEEVEGLPVVDTFGRTVRPTTPRIRPGPAFPISECDVCCPPESWADALEGL